MKDETIAIHAGFKADSATKSVSVPIYQTVAYEFDSAQHGADLFNLEVEGNIYTRIMNPTTAVLEERCAALEGGIAGLGLSAGSAAVNYSILNIAEKGNNIVTVPLLYGGTYTLFKHMLPRQGIDVRFAEDDSADAMASLIDALVRPGLLRFLRVGIRGNPVAWRSTSMKTKFFPTGRAEYGL